MTTEPTQSNQLQRGEYALMFLVVGLVVGWVLILAFAIAAPSHLSVFGVGSMVAAASTLIGAFLGFLFGVPRTLQETGNEDKGSDKTANRDQKQSAYRPNTNLEQISDWLTKVLLGAGLTQISSIRVSIRNLGTTLAPGFGGMENASAFAIVTVMYYLFDGFLIGYLWTRLYLAGAMVEADVETLTRQINEIKEQSDVDAKALALAIKQLNPSADRTTPTQKELNDAVRDASQPVRAQIFYQAQTVRQETWSEPGKKAKMERTIPLFRALIACDADEAYHRNYGQLGYALRDQRAPDWVGAAAALTKAIEIRGSGTDHGWGLYEFNRAMCKIMTDGSFKRREKSDPDSAKRISDDLKSAANAEDFVRAIIREEQVVQDWLLINDVQI
jgi:hypothetical protein